MTMCRSSKKCLKWFSTLILLLALVMAVLVSVLPQERLVSLFFASRFIETMIPILAVGALVKYLFTSPKSCGRQDNESGSAS